MISLRPSSQVSRAALGLLRYDGLERAQAPLFWGERDALRALLVFLVNDSEYSDFTSQKYIQWHGCFYLVSPGALLGVGGCVVAARCIWSPSRGGRGDGPGKLIPRL
jgi:hypothetical protein